MKPWERHIKKGAACSNIRPSARRIATGQATIAAELGFAGEDLAEVRVAANRLFLLGLHDECLELIEALWLLGDVHPLSLVMAAECHLLLGDRGRAREVFEQSRGILPSTDDCRPVVEAVDRHLAALRSVPAVVTREQPSG